MSGRRQLITAGNHEVRDFGTVAALMRRFGVAAAVLALGIVGCGGSGGGSSVQTQTSSDSAQGGQLWASCPTAHASYVKGKEEIQIGRKGLAKGKEVKASESLIRIGEKELRESVQACKIERETHVLEAGLCSRTPAEMTAMLREKESRRAYEAAGAYEATCGKRVPNP